MVVRALLRTGVREVVVCAGARNAALVAVVARCRSLRVWSHPEERSAAFFALGRAVATSRPVAVVTTSGTAAAELLPAVIEAHYQGVPLVAVTADRPPEFRGTGAPQAIEQPGLFGPYVAACCDVADESDAASLEWALDEWSRRQPMHLNVCLDEPQAAELSAVPALAAGFPAPRAVVAADAAALSAFLAKPGRLLAVVGTLPAAQQANVAAFLRKCAVPCWCEATSGLREADGLRHVDEAGVAGGGWERVLRVGGVPSLRFWRDLESLPSISVFHVCEPTLTGLARGGGVCGYPDWDEVSVPPASAAQMPTLKSTLPPPRGEGAWMRELSRVIPEGALVFLGNSLPVRQWNTWAVREPRGLRCHANRGANGIDGCLSTFLGLSADEAESWAVVGDLTALYDLAGLWPAAALPVARRRIVIVNNGGGRIFRQVAALRGLDAGQWRLMENPHALNFAPLAELWGWAYRRLTDPAELGARSDARHEIIELVVSAEEAGA